MEELLFRLTSSDSASSAQPCNISQLTQSALNLTRGIRHEVKARAISPGLLTFLLSRKTLFWAQREGRGREGSGHREVRDWHQFPFVEQWFPPSGQVTSAVWISATVLWFRRPGSRLPARKALTWRRSLATCKDRNHSREGFTVGEIRFGGQEELSGWVLGEGAGT